jgi:glyoxylase-like metal-dependent hydrolase (beta-lactamase superfamily II)
MVSVRVFCFNAFSENTFLIESNSSCIVVDPGCYESSEYKELTDYIEAHHLTPQSIINTHCHIDHVLGVDYLKHHYNIPFIIGEKELPVLHSAKLIAPVYGFNMFKEPDHDRLLTEGEEIVVGDSSWSVLDVPGHSPGHIALYEAHSKICLAGDVLFLNSIGRTDLPGGDYDTLINSIRTKLFVLPDDVVVYPGHGPETTIGEEKINNPFCGLNP